MISIKGINDTAPQTSTSQLDLFNPAPIHDPIINNTPAPDSDNDPIQQQAILAATLGAAETMLEQVLCVA